MVGAAVVRRLKTEPCELVVAGREEVDLTRQADVERWMDRQRLEHHARDDSDDGRECGDHADKSGWDPEDSDDCDHGAAGFSEYQAADGRERRSGAKRAGGAKKKR